MYKYLILADKKRPVPAKNKSEECFVLNITSYKAVITKL